jgi:hypothetical protein
MREINNGLLAAAAKVKQAERATSELCANDFFSAQSGRAENNRVKKHAKGSCWLSCRGACAHGRRTRPSSGCGIYASTETLHSRPQLCQCSFSFSWSPINPTRATPNLIARTATVWIFEALLGVVCGGDSSHMELVDRDSVSNSLLEPDPTGDTEATDSVSW